MAERLGSHGGGITGLIDLIDGHGAALEYDLIKLGLRLRDCPSEHFDWRDLLVIVRHSNDRSALWQSQNPKYTGWTLTDRLLAIIANALRWLVWAKTKDGSKNRNRPVPIGPDMGDKTRRPGLKVKPSPVSRVKKALGLGDDDSRLGKLRKVFGG